MDLDNLLAWLRERMDDGEYATAETFLNDMNTRVIDGDEFRTGADAKIEELKASIDGLEAANKELKARNYDLLMKVPSDDSDPSPVDDEVDDEGEVIHIDDLFKDEESDKED